MLTISQNIQDEWLSLSRAIKFKVLIGSVQYTGDDVVSFDYSGSSMGGTTLNVGATPINTISMKFNSIVPSLFVGMVVQPSIGIVLPDTTISYIPLGKFTITKFNRNVNDVETTLEASDFMLQLSKNYSSSITYPASLKNIAIEVAINAGVDYNVNNLNDLPDVWLPKKYTGGTLRDVAGYIAQFDAGFATFNRQGQLEFRRISGVELELGLDNYDESGFDKNEALSSVGKLTSSVTVGDTQQAISAGSGSNAIELTNPQMTQSLLNDISGRLSGISFSPYTLNWSGFPAIELGDSISIVDRSGSAVTVPVLSMSFSYDGGLSSTISADTSGSGTAVLTGSLTQKLQSYQEATQLAIGEVQQSADGKSKIFYGTQAPTKASVDDTWFKFSDDGVPQAFRYNGTSWEVVFESLSGTDGVGIAGVSVTYVATTDGSTTPTTGWTTAIPTVTQGKWLWSKTLTIFSDGNQTTTYSKTYVGVDGLQGVAGPAGYIVSNTAPANPSIGTVWQNTSVSPKQFKRWTGTDWVDHYIYSDNMVMSNGFITNAMISDATITSAKIAALDAGKITTGYLSASRIQASSITSDKLSITNGFITNAMISDATITSAKIASLSADKISAGTISGVTVRGISGGNYVQLNGGAATLQFVGTYNNGSINTTIEPLADAPTGRTILGTTADWYAGRTIRAVDNISTDALYKSGSAYMNLQINTLDGTNRNFIGSSDGKYGVIFWSGGLYLLYNGSAYNVKSILGGSTWTM
ncbi:hypothetical protein EQG49_02275 [Periweissella cryptocerci]|uniref:Uncharacterized protein n=1 Tax=Periweissella cryptocerci TaxID=2506420 RepID=A0A4P6YRZ7_9LACO|nr:hypothetical protein [Periweissella cryptocerci]QBO35373.1 hypothetical protein EQG49_02275 [Periweissella cryptocerci]